MKEGTIYIVTNLINQKQYIGQTIRKFKERQEEHFRSNKCIYFYRALKKYGKENFKWISFKCPMEDLDYNERLLIKELKTQKPNGYNIEFGGHKNKILYKETKKKMSLRAKERLKNKENHPMWGKHHSEESKQKIRNNKPDQSGEKNGMFGKHHSENILIKMRGLRPSMQGENNHMFGKHHSEETIQKIIKNLPNKNGENNPNGKLKKETVIEIKKLLKENQLNNREIQSLFNITESNFYNIKCNKTWREI